MMNEQDSDREMGIDSSDQLYLLVNEKEDDRDINVPLMSLVKACIKMVLLFLLQTTTECSLLVIYCST